MTSDIGKRAMENLDEVNAAAVDYLMYSGYTLLAYFWAKSTLVSEAALAAGTDRETFYQNKISTAKFYFAKLLPRTESLVTSIKAGTETLMLIAAEDMLLD